MKKQRGGTVSVWVVLALVALAMSEASMIRYLYAHRVIQIVMPAFVPAPHKGPIGVFPEGAYSCGSPGAICYLKT